MVGSGVGNQFRTFDAEFKFAKKTQKCVCVWGGGDGGWEPTFNFDAEARSVIIPKSHCGGVGRGANWWTSNFQNLSPNLDFLFLRGGGGGFRLVNTNIWCWHLVRIWGELQKIDKKMFHPVLVSASQLVCCGDYKSKLNLGNADFPWIPNGYMDHSLV